MQSWVTEEMCSVYLILLMKQEIEIALRFQIQVETLARKIKVDAVYWCVKNRRLHIYFLE